jgi:hypothetical protein
MGIDKSAKGPFYTKITTANISECLVRYTDDIKGYLVDLGGDSNLPDAFKLSQLPNYDQDNDFHYVLVFDELFTFITFCKRYDLEILHH